jgi:branched-chain amino acid aminotransferase
MWPPGMVISMIDDSYEPVSWIDGQLKVDPLVSANNQGFLTGMGVFETLKVTNSHPEFLDRHLNRLSSSAQRIGLPLLSKDALGEAVTEVIHVNQIISGSARLRITVTAQNDTSSVFVSMSKLDPWPGLTSCIVAPWLRNNRSPLSGIKSTSYAENVLALSWARGLGYSEAIFFDTAGRLAEGATSNIFVVTNGEILTPSESTGILPGVIRQVLLDAKMVKEADLTVADLDSAQELFLTSSTRGVHPVIRINDRNLDGVGETTQKIIREFGLLRE